LRSITRNLIIKIVIATGNVIATPVIKLFRSLCHILFLLDLKENLKH